MSHAKFSPSAAARWLACGYSIKMAPFYRETTNRAAEHGTEKHAIAEMHLLNGTEPRDPKLRVYTNAVRGALESHPEGKLFVEQKVIIVPELCEGTLDAAVATPDWLHNFDLKYGKSPVSATENPQQMLYGLGIALAFDLPKDFPVTLTIVQPNASSGWPVKNWDTNVGYLLKFKETVDRAIEEGLKENPKAVAGHHCYWCPAKMHCQAFLIHKGKK